MSPSAKERTLGSRNGELGAKTLARTEGSGWLSHTMGSQPSTKVSGKERAGSEGQEPRSETDSMSDRPVVRIYCTVASSVASDVTREWVPQFLL